MHVDFSPLLPLPLVAVLALVGFGAAILAVLLRQRGSVLRVLAVAAFVLALLNPSLVREERERLKDVVGLVVDRSASQSLSVRPGQIDPVAEAVQKRLAALPDVEVRPIEVRESAGDDGTRLFSALQSGLADVPPERIAGAIMVTDGVVHDIPDQAALLGFKAPVHALITGFEGERDRRIELIDTPRFGIVGRDQTIRLRIDDPGHEAPIRVVVRRDGEQVLAREAFRRRRTRAATSASSRSSALS